MSATTKGGVTLVQDIVIEVNCGVVTEIIVSDPVLKSLTLSKGVTETFEVTHTTDSQD